MQSWLITGANGNLGRRLIKQLLEDAGCAVVAVVRSERARRMLDELELNERARARLTVRVLSYTDVEALRDAAESCNKAVHLVGILKQTRSAPYEQAHERSTAALLEALAGSEVDHLTYLSIVGSRSASPNACLASKGRAEDLCRASSLATCVLRVPMVLGEGDYASFALKARAAKSSSMTFRAESLEQPIYADDVVRAIVAAGTLGVDASLDLGGPETLSRRALTERAAGLSGHSCRVVSLPIWLGRAFAGLMETVSADPPVTRAMLDVLDHDDDIDPEAALQTLRLDGLTPLDETLRRVLA